MQVVAIRFKKRLSTFLPVVTLLAFQLPVVLLLLDVARFRNVISLKRRKTAAVRFNLFWKDRIVYWDRVEEERKTINCTNYTAN